MKSDLLSVVEAAYRIEQPEEAWVRGLMQASQPLIDVGLGVYAYLFDASDPTNLKVRALSAEGQREGFMQDALVAALGQTPKEYVVQSWRSRPCGYASEVPGYDQLESVKTYFCPNGIADIFSVCASDPTGSGCYLGAGRPRRGKLKSSERATWERVSAHLAASFRLRRALGASVLQGAEAVLSPSGKVEHAEGAGTDRGAREALREAVRSMDRARVKTRRVDPTEALKEWRGLVAARWSLVEHFESDGHRYLVARRNDPDAAGPDALTRRERQVLGYAALGHSNKLIAYELGVSASTVGVLFLRAARKLRQRSRADVIAAWRAATGG